MAKMFDPSTGGCRLVDDLNFSEATETVRCSLDGSLVDLERLVAERDDEELAQAFQRVEDPLRYLVEQRSLINRHPAAPRHKVDPIELADKWFEGATEPPGN